MSCPRLIPLLLHKHGRLVLSRQFQTITTSATRSRSPTATKGGTWTS